jgi:putative tryptophan/tyrosine transport system substrate-binding protein
LTLISAASDFNFSRKLFPSCPALLVLSHGALGADQEELTETQAAARTLGVQIQSLTVQEPSQFLSAYAEMIKRRIDALIFFGSAFTLFYRTELVELAIKNRLPMMCANVAWVDTGCLISYGPNIPDLYRRAATYVDKILKGTKPADLPVEQPTKFEFIINLKAAKQIGLTIPPNVMARADRVIKEAPG